MNRWTFWLLSLFVLAYFDYQSTVSESRLAIENGDGSALAWHAFIIYIWPIFFIKPLIIIGISSVVLGTIIWFKNRSTNAEK